MDEKILKKSKRLRRELGHMRIDADLVYRENCTDEENEKFLRMRKQQKELPEDVYEVYKTGTFFRIHELDVSWEEEIESILLRQSDRIRSIEMKVIILLMIAIAPIALYLFAALSGP